jgi:sugar phosphate isomerase/epimerase
VLQSLWAMQDSGTSFHDISVEEAVERAISAGFDGMSLPFHDADVVERAMYASKGTDFALEALCIVDSSESFKRVVELAINTGVHHINLQPNIRANEIAKAISIIEEWYTEACAAGVPLALAAPPKLCRIEVENGRPFNSMRHSPTQATCFALECPPPLAVNVPPEQPSV